ncbi:MAG TPA: GIY-YIG nuclease family protein [Capillimicrobium sp.]|nr:GIY-YIG nuclease family protein [Capillimicrobium sp.]
MDATGLDLPAAWVYLLRCADGSLYCGWTNDLRRRLAAHAAGRASRYTASRRPVTLAAALPMPDRSSAMREEARIKRLPRAEKLTLLHEDLHPVAASLRDSAAEAVQGARGARPRRATRAA